MVLFSILYLEKYDSSERELLKQHIDNIEDLVDLKKIILIMDAGYYSLELKLILEKRGINYIFRLPPSTYRYEISQMKKFRRIFKIQQHRRKKTKNKRQIYIKKGRKITIY